MTTLSGLMGAVIVGVEASLGEDDDRQRFAMLTAQG